MVSSAGARHVEQVPLRLVDVLEIRFVGHGLDALLERDDLVVAGHHRDGAKLEALVDKADKPAKYAALLLKLAAKYPALLRDAQPPKPKKEKAKPPPKPAKKEKRDEAPTPDASAEATVETVEADDGSDDDAAAEDEDEEVIDLDAEL